MSTKNSNRFRAGLRALTNPANLPDFAPGEYDEEWEQARRFQRDFLSDDVRLGGTIWGDEPAPGMEFCYDPDKGVVEREAVRGPFRHNLPNFYTYTVPAAEQLDPAPFYGWGDEPLTPLQPLPERESFNWKAFRFYALAFTGLVLSQVVIALAVNASR